MRRPPNALFSDRRLAILRFPVPALLCVAGLASGCAASSQVSGDGGSTQVISIVTAEGETLELRRSPDALLSQRIAVTPAEAWAVLPGVYGLLGIQLDNRIDAQRRLGASRHRFSRQIMGRRASDFFECGTDPGLNRPLADQSPIDAQVFTQVLPTAEGAELRTSVQASARRTGGSAGVARCESTGMLETVIARLVHDLVVSSR